MFLGQMRRFALMRVVTAVKLGRYEVAAITRRIPIHATHMRVGEHRRGRIDYNITRMLDGLRQRIALVFVPRRWESE